METDKNTAGMAGMPKKKTPPMFSFQRLGYGIEMIGALGNTDEFGFAWQRQKQYVGPVFSYSAIADFLSDDAGLALSRRS